MDTALHVAGELGARGEAKPPSPDAIISVTLPAILLALAWPEQPATQARCGTVVARTKAAVPVGTLPRLSWHDANLGIDPADQTVKRLLLGAASLLITRLHCLPPIHIYIISGCARFGFRCSIIV